MTRSLAATALLFAALPLAAQASDASQQAAAVNHESLHMASQSNAPTATAFDNDAFRYSGMSVAMVDSQRGINADDTVANADQADDERSWLEILSDNNRHLGAPAGW
ncbi:hypothetical protein [Chromohalobacter sp. HP20-39]|uniref:hypothetical protein n=1 Tax=Chromohalobacter sp. HP20-39 TaxID=3079306 RepID=UPI00294ABFC7|nr:hypothetical protein [Chromohalobacter sp. HP20-39]MDV6318308.1 hypothetical protein [Chromohalobacter sp. HP20-39]